MDVQDVIIVGGGPAGLNAAVVLGRCRRKVIIFDTGEQRNRSSHGMHNYLTRDAILPSDFLKLCYAEIKKYGVNLLFKKITNARKNKDDVFVVHDEQSNIYYSKKLLIATGLIDKIPTLPGFKELYGKFVFHCPYCDGWEVRDKKLGVYAKDKDGWEMALNLKSWSRDITLFTDGGKKIKSAQQQQLDANGIEVITELVDKLDEKNGELKFIVLKNGKEIPCDALFFVNGFTQHCDLTDVFDCETSKKGVIVTNKYQQTSTPGLFVAGDADKDMHFVIVAAAEGAKAGVIINKELQKDITDRGSSKK
jgi:thioredoxin reductase